MKIQELWVERAKLRNMRQVEREAAPLVEGEIRVAIDKFALTANNVSYAISGEEIGYWKYFPAEGEWGKPPVWGFADVVESRSAEIKQGERLWGFFPIATELTLKPGAVKAQSFIDFAPHRKELPGLYNLYYRTSNDPPAMKPLEDARCLLFPLFATSYILYDYLLAHDFFGAEQILIGSASSKTGFGLAWLLKNDRKHPKRVVGLTSAANVDFVKGLGCYDEVVRYEDIGKLDAARSTAFVDMAGAASLIQSVHEHFRDSIRESAIVGATHWESDRKRGPLPGAKPKFFFAPAHIARREQEWGAGAFMPKALMASMQIVGATAKLIDVAHLRGPDAVQQAFLDLLDNRVPPSRGLMLSMKS